jgi:leucyl-tRNA synthetase
MDTFIDSSWYQYRYLSPHEADHPFDPAPGAYWLPVDQYTGGVEHAVMHLMYTRFWTKVMRDLGLVGFGEPMRRLFNQGTILGEDGEKMSKSRGNVVNPDAYVGTVGADVVRTYLMFIGPWEGGGPWNSRGIEGVQRFLHRVWALVRDDGDAGRANPVPGSADRRPADRAVRELRHWTHRTIKKVTEDLEGFQFNTAISAMMEFVNYLQRARDSMGGTPAWTEAQRTLILLLAPVTPHLSEELWERLGGPYSVHQQRWPSYDGALAQAEMVTLVLQVDGKVRDRIQVSADLGEGEARELALHNEKVKKFMDGRSVADVVVVPRRLVNVVTR